MKNILILFLTIFSSSIKIEAQIIYNFAGSTAGCSGDGGPAVSAQILNTNGMAIDNSGNVYLSNNSNIRKVNSAGIISTIASSCSLSTGYTGDGGQATQATFAHPAGIAIDANGNIYIADGTNFCIRKINTAGIVNTIAGNGTLGYSGDGVSATSALMGRPSGIAVDLSGNIFFADIIYHCIRKINTAGIITTIAGTGTSGYSGDGGNATAAQMYNPGSIVIDGSGNLYFIDALNFRIRKINTSGIITTFAGTGTAGYSGDGGMAALANIYANGLAIDGAGNFYFTDPGSAHIRKINNSGIINTIAGNGTSGNTGNGGPPLAAQIINPGAIAISSSGTIYFSQSAPGPNPSNVRIICQNNCLAGLNLNSKLNNELFVYPNPNNGIFKTKIDYDIKNGKFVLLNSIGQKMFEKNVAEGDTEINTKLLSKGFYNYILYSDDQKIKTGKIVIE